jgi:hypothetical protein
MEMRSARSPPDWLMSAAQRVAAALLALCLTPQLDLRVHLLAFWDSARQELCVRKRITPGRYRLSAFQLSFGLQDLWFSGSFYAPFIREEGSFFRDELHFL